MLFPASISHTHWIRCSRPNSSSGSGTPPGRLRMVIRNNSFEWMLHAHRIKQQICCFFELTITTRLLLVNNEYLNRRMEPRRGSRGSDHNGSGTVTHYKSGAISGAARAGVNMSCILGHWEVIPLRARSGRPAFTNPPQVGTKSPRSVAAEPVICREGAATPGTGCGSCSAPCHLVS